MSISSWLTFSVLQVDISAGLHQQLGAVDITNSCCEMKCTAHRIDTYSDADTVVTASLGVSLSCPSAAAD